ncbi:MAG: RimK family alpha-L-glutamate ligase [Candidatus Bathyarchaeota archaeon]|nr:RimK family alpha-L-glutamate ligase [Candidatus Bathyarchaeota archaeon]
MKVLILYGSVPSKNSEELVEAAKAQGHEVVGGQTAEVSSEVSPSGSRFWLRDIEVTDFDVCILRSFGPGSCEQSTRRISLLEHMEVAGIRVVNPCYAFRRARDKYATQYTLEAAGLPIPTTYTTESMADAYRVSEAYGEFIYKPILSSMGKGAMKFSDPDLAYNAYKMLDRYSQPLILQKYVQNPGRDIRVFVIGEEVVGSAYKYRAKGKWKTNVAQGGTMVDEKVPEDILELGLSATQAMGLDYSGVDVIESPDGPVILEVNGSPGWQALNLAAGIKVADEIVRHAVSLVHG